MKQFFNLDKVRELYKYFSSKHYLKVNYLICNVETRRPIERG